MNTKKLFYLLSDKFEECQKEFDNSKQLVEQYILLGKMRAFREIMGIINDGDDKN